MDSLPAAARLTAAAFIALLSARLAVWRTPFAQLVRGYGVVGRDAPPAALPPGQQHAADRVAAAVVRAADPFGPLANCLVRCFAAATLLRRYGIPYTIYCGASPATPGKLDGHAWLRAGTITIGAAPAGSRFTVMLTIHYIP